MRARVVSATEFKAKCLAILDQVEEQGGTVMITKRGRPVAVLAPAPRKAWRSLEGIWAGKVPADLADMDVTGLWEVANQ